jgi:ATP adenylyltransferase/5',5'''-P-1,P-4-tetraphosphate phosphorylase II
VGLRESQTRSERVFGREVLVRHIPHRIKSTTAAVDAVSVAQRKCFLCAGNLDPEEEGIPFEDGFTLYCNPFPILDRHLTIVHKDHTPQRISGQFAPLLKLARALPDSFVIYNGPQCGASAPDHLHFQSCSRTTFPIQNDDLNGYIPRVLVFRGSDMSPLVSSLETAVEKIAAATKAVAEPMLNIDAFFAQDSWTVLTFPRAKHRPRVYETKELTVSPATIDLCGVFVVPVFDDYQKIRGTDIEKILEEVTMPATQFDSVLKSLEAQQ